jgi:hypothetical protein
LAAESDNDDIHMRTPTHKHMSVVISPKSNVRYSLIDYFNECLQTQRFTKPRTGAHIRRLLSSQMQRKKVIHAAVMRRRSLRPVCIHNKRRYLFILYFPDNN